MSAETSLKAGRLDEALLEVQDAVRARPDDVRQRVFLFQLLAVLGQWQRCLTQLNIVGELDASALLMVNTYRELLNSEALRQQVFAGRRTPVIVGEPAPWLALLIQALAHDAQGHPREAQALRAQAYEQAQPTSGAIDGEPFTWIADADSRIGPCLEWISDGGYSWVPFSRLSAINFSPPEDLRDMVWLPAEATWATGARSVGFVPVRYPGSETHEAPTIRLARETRWQELGDNAYTGLGQRMLATDVGEIALLDVREIRFDAAPG